MKNDKLGVNIYNHEDHERMFAFGIELLINIVKGGLLKKTELADGGRNDYMGLSISNRLIGKLHKHIPFPTRL